MKKKLGKANSHEDELILLDKRELLTTCLAWQKLAYKRLMLSYKLPIRKTH